MWLSEAVQVLASSEGPPGLLPARQAPTRDISLLEYRFGEIRGGHR
jgi:hypothetical protein